MNPSPAPILVLCRDLLFGSKITAAARALNLPVHLIRDPTRLADAPSARAMLVDLNQPGSLDAAADWKARTRGQVLGFASHTDTATLARAKSLGITALSRGGLDAHLPEILSQLAAAEHTGAHDAAPASATPKNQPTRPPP
jgi:hypothetical protein